MSSPFDRLSEEGDAAYALAIPRTDNPHLVHPVGRQGAGGRAADEGKRRGRTMPRVATPSAAGNDNGGLHVISFRQRGQAGLATDTETAPPDGLAQQTGADVPGGTPAPGSPCRPRVSGGFEICDTCGQRWCCYEANEQVHECRYSGATPQRRTKPAPFLPDLVQITVGYALGVMMTAAGVLLKTPADLDMAVLSGVATGTGVLAVVLIFIAAAHRAARA